MERTSLPELLAPAGSMEALKAAVNTGADAAYLSGKNFGARQYAANFDEEQMVQALEYAHLRNVKVYVTVNTLVYDSELESVARYLIWLYEIGVDALILQDVGVASICRELIPDMDLHASTQMTINSTEGVKWTAESGFKRVVLARELTLPEVEEIAVNVDKNIELEIFAHGALCYSYSGQCLLSSVIGGRSGNRGRCAQPCRKPYQLLKGVNDDYGKLARHTSISTAGDYLLSTRDLALYPELGKLSRTPISSLKIEGRMRSPEYVALVVSTYRKALDKILNNQWKPDESDISRLKLTFNREFTSGYFLEDNKKRVMGCEAPGNRGLQVGRVVKNNGEKLLIQLNPGLPDYMLDKGDGIVFLFKNRDKFGMSLDLAPIYIDPHKMVLKLKKRIPEGTEVYLTRDISLMREVKSSMKKETGYHKPLTIDMRLDQNNTPILTGDLHGKDGEVIYTEFKANFAMKPARKSPLTKHQIIEQLKKTGGTPFQIREVKMDYPGNLFAPLSQINNMRREFLENAQKEIIKSYQPGEESLKNVGYNFNKFRPYLQTTSRRRNKSEKPPMEVSVYTSSLQGVKGALDGGCGRIYFEPHIWENEFRENPCEAYNQEDYLLNIEEILLKAQDFCNSHGIDLIWKWPSITGNSYLKVLPDLACQLEKEGLSEIMMGSMGDYRAVSNLNDTVKLSGSESLNITNHVAVDYFSNFFNRLTLSSEICKSELGPILSRNYDNTVSFDIMVQGNLESMVSEDCLLTRAKDFSEDKNVQWGLLDSKGRIFP
ncbi:MAG TPA: U32 family peptidase, partial [Methanobacterium sp.]|nr:U32 family peptidase [Methanobacterium sp.]